MQMEISVVKVFFWWLLPWIIATVVGVKKNRGVFGFLLGMLFGWLGMIIVCCFKKNEKGN